MLKAILPLSLVVCLRFFGLFIVLPVIALYVGEFGDTSPLLLGLAVGGAYLTQILFQTPFGILSDKIDRKKVVMAGLFIFLVGSVICALAHSIEMLIIGRLVQGAGAIGGVVSAQITDLTREEKRTQAMAIMGGGIFASFILAMLLGPLIGGHFGCEWLFAITALLSFVSMLLLGFCVPETPKIHYSYEEAPSKRILTNKNLAIMNLSSFLEKAFMTLIFVVIPLVFVEELAPIVEMGKEDLWKVYTPAAILAILALAPASILAEKYSKAKLVMGYGIALFMVAYIAIAYGAHSNMLWLFIGGIVLFFLGFATLEPIMQSLTSKYAKAHNRGVALGVFTTFNYIGSFAGGMLGGILYHTLGIIELGVSIAVVCAAWLLTLLALDNPAKQKNIYLSLSKYPTQSLARLSQQAGIIECYANKSEGTIIVKYDTQVLDEAQAQGLADSILYSQSIKQNP